VVDTSSAEEFALAHGLVGGANGRRLFVPVFDGAVNARENIAGDVLASGTTLPWNASAKGFNGGAMMADASLNRRQTIRVGAGVAFAPGSIVGFDGQIELEALRLFGLLEAARRPRRRGLIPAATFGDRWYSFSCPQAPAGNLRFPPLTPRVSPHKRRAAFRVPLALQSNANGCPFAASARVKDSCRWYYRCR
jgi:hypothetical protein